MIGVGLLAAILNVALLLVVVVADRAAQLIVRGFAISRLKANRRAPVVHDSDVWLLNIPCSILKYRKHPAITLTLMCAFCLVVSEMLSELGVDVSRKCWPAQKKGLVTSPNMSESGLSSFKHLAAAIQLQETAFLDGNLTAAVTNFPVDISPFLCISCLRSPVNNAITTNCTVKREKTYEAGSLKIGIAQRLEPLGYVAYGFSEIDNNTSQPPKSFLGDGDITWGSSYLAAFVVHGMERDDGLIELTYFEYANQNHCLSMLKAVVNNARIAPGTPFQRWEVTRSRVRTHSIVCKKNALDLISFRLAVQIFRSIQLENVFNPIPFDAQSESFREITEDDIYRAVISLEMAKGQYVAGKYLVYSECGHYKWRFLLPFLICLCLLTVLGIASAVSSMRGGRVDVPYSSKSWYEELVRRRYGKCETSTDKKEQSHNFRIFRWSYDEMYLPENVEEDSRVEWFREPSSDRDVGNVTPGQTPRKNFQRDNSSSPRSIALSAESENDLSHYSTSTNNGFTSGTDGLR